MGEHASLFGRAALVARDPARFQFVAELSEEEKTALQYEKDHKWHGPFMLWYSISLCAVGAATQGWDRKCFSITQSSSIRLWKHASVSCEIYVQTL